MVAQDWCKSVFRIEDPEPYPQLNEGQKIGALEVLSGWTVTIHYIQCSSLLVTI